MMKSDLRIIMVLILTVLIAVSLTACGSGSGSESGNSETSLLPQLSVVGNKIVDDKGNPKVLRGVTIIDPFFMKEVHYNGPREEDFKVLAHDWNAQIIRVPVHPELWEISSNYLEDYLDPVVEWGNKYGMYIFIGYHAHGNPITEEVEYPDWRNYPPWQGNPYNPDKALAISVLTDIAQRYKEKSWVIYGIFNEPSYITWDEWRPVAEELVDVIHSINPTALIVVPGVDWGYDLSSVLDNPVNRSNVVYEIHPYPLKDDSWKNVVRTVSEKYPVFIGEWGFPEEYGGLLYGTRDDYGEPLVNIAKELNIGWTAWIWHHEWTPSILTSIETYDVTDFGALVKDSL